MKSREFLIANISINNFFPQNLIRISPFFPKELFQNSTMAAYDADVQKQVSYKRSFAARCGKVKHFQWRNLSSFQMKNFDSILYSGIHWFIFGV